MEYFSSNLIRAVALLSKVIATFHHFLLLFIIFVFKELLHHSYDSHVPRGVLLFRSKRTESSRITNKQQQEEELKAEAEKQPVITFLITDGPVKGRMHLENCKKQNRTWAVGWTSSADWRRSYRRASLKQEITNRPPETQQSHKKIKRERTNNKQSACH